MILGFSKGVLYIDVILGLLFRVSFCFFCYFLRSSCRRWELSVYDMNLDFIRLVLFGIGGREGEWVWVEISSKYLLNVNSFI